MSNRWDVSVKIGEYNFSSATAVKGVRFSLQPNDGTRYEGVLAPVDSFAGNYWLVVTENLGKRSFTVDVRDMRRSLERLVAWGQESPALYVTSEMPYLAHLSNNNSFSMKWTAFVLATFAVLYTCHDLESALIYHADIVEAIYHNSPEWVAVLQEALN